MEIFDDIVMLELQREEWEKESAKSPIFLPDQVREKQDGKVGEKIPYHFFKVVAVGSKCTKVKVGNRIFPKPPNLHSQAQLQMILVWINGVKTARFVIREEDIGGVE